MPGAGVSSPVIVGDKVIVACYSGYGLGGGDEKIEDLKRHVVCVNRKVDDERSDLVLGVAGEIWGMNQVAVVDKVGAA